MQVGIDVTCMHTNFGGCGLFGFRDKITFQKRPNFPFRASMVIIKFNQLESAAKIYASRDCVTYMHSNFSGRGLSSFGDIAAFKNGQISHHQSHYPLSSVTLLPYCMSWGFSLMNYLLYQDYVCVCVFSEVTCKG